MRRRRAGRLAHGDGRRRRAGARGARRRGRRGQRRRRHRDDVLRVPGRDRHRLARGRRRTTSACCCCATSATASTSTCSGPRCAPRHGSDARRTARASPSAPPTRRSGPHQLRRLALRAAARAGPGRLLRLRAAPARSGSRSRPGEPGSIANDDLNPYFAAACEAAHEAVFNCLVAARPAERLDGTMQDAFPIERVRELARRRDDRRRPVSAVEPLTSSPLRDEVVELAQDLIRVDTSNPPGGETPAAELLGAYLRRAGVAVRAGRPGPRAAQPRRPGRGRRGPSLMLMAHTDVVPAPAEQLDVAAVRGRASATGTLVGRGAADMKGELAARAVAFAALARSGEPPPGRRGAGRRGRRGAATRSDCRHVVAGARAARPALRLRPQRGRRLLLELADGRPGGDDRGGREAGHRGPAADLRHRRRTPRCPTAADNPVGHLRRAIERLAAERQPVTVGPAVARALQVLGADPADEASLAAAWAAAAPGARRPACRR